MEIVKTRLEEILQAHPAWPKLLEAEHPKTQSILREMMLKLSEEISSDMYCEQNKAVYSRIAKQYAENPTNKSITRPLLDFMSRPEIPNGGFVLDIGCGHGRDVAFMATSDIRWREAHMKRPLGNGLILDDVYRAPDNERVFRVVGVDIPQMNPMARIQKDCSSALGLVSFIPGDINNLSEIAFTGEVFDGVWSCSAFGFTTPYTMLFPNIKQIARILKPSGVFGLTYGQGRKLDHFERERTNRSRTPYNELFLPPEDSPEIGIRYFSRPLKEEIEGICASVGLVMKYQTTSDFFDTGTGRFNKDLFVSQIFVKQD